MAKRNPFRRIRLVYHRSPMFLKVFVLVTILLSAAALLTLRAIMLNYRQQSQVLQTQAIALQQENEELTERIAELGTEKSIRRIAREQLGLMDPGAEFYDTGK